MTEGGRGSSGLERVGAALFACECPVQFYDLEQVAQALEDALSGKVIKPVLRMNDSH